jgi:hypothetical protein
MTLNELLTELNNRISATAISGFWTASMKKEWINKAGERICNFKRWKFLEKAKWTYSTANREYYDYPDDFKANSIYYMEVDGKEYIEKSWDDYQAFKAAGSTDKIFANHNEFYFINPIPKVSGLEILIFGIRKWLKLTADTDKPILPSEFDEAIIKLALATALQKERRYSEATFEIGEVEGANGILAKIAEREDEETKGHIGKATHVHFLM